MISQENFIVRHMQKVVPLWPDHVNVQCRVMDDSNVLPVPSTHGIAQVYEVSVVWKLRGAVRDDHMLPGFIDRARKQYQYELYADCLGILRRLDEAIWNEDRAEAEKFLKQLKEEMMP